MDDILYTLNKGTEVHLQLVRSNTAYLLCGRVQDHQQGYIVVDTPTQTFVEPLVPALPRMVGVFARCSFSVDLFAVVFSGCTQKAADVGREVSHSMFGFNHLLLHFLTRPSRAGDSRNASR